MKATTGDKGCYLLANYRDIEDIHGSSIKMSPVNRTQCFHFPNLQKSVVFFALIFPGTFLLSIDFSGPTSLFTGQATGQCEFSSQQLVKT